MGGLAISTVIALQAIQGASAFSPLKAAGSALNTAWDGVGFAVKKTVEGSCEVVGWVVDPILEATGIKAAFMKAVNAAVHEFIGKPILAGTAIATYYVNKNFLEPACQSAAADYVVTCSEGILKNPNAQCLTSAMLWGTTCGMSMGAHLMETELFLQAMPDPVVKRALELTKYVINFLKENKLVAAGGTFALGYYILHPLCVEAQDDYTANCKSVFDDLRCTAAGTKLVVACGAELAAYIGAGKLFCDAVFPGICVLATYI